MKFATWNARGFTSQKTHVVSELIRSADLLCLTETWSDVEPADDWEVINTRSINVDGTNRREGGVALLFTPSSQFRHIASYSNRYFQLIHGTITGVPVLACYVVPRTPPEELQRFLAIAHRCLQGPGVLMGDFNARQSAWDDQTTPQGRRIHRWVQAHNFSPSRPTEPTVQTPLGCSRVHLVFHRGPAPPILTTLPATSWSDHRPVMATLTLSTPQNLNYIPICLVENERCRVRAQTQYKKDLPPIIDAIRYASTAVSL